MMALSAPEKMKMFSFVVDEKTREKIVELAKLAGTTVSHAARHVLVQNVDKELADVKAAKPRSKR